MESNYPKVEKFKYTQSYRDSLNCLKFRTKTEWRAFLSIEDHNNNLYVFSSKIKKEALTYISKYEKAI